MDEDISKSQKKREALHLQQIGVALIALSIDKLATLPLTPQLFEAIKAAKTIKTHGGIRRQAQLIGKLMRQASHGAIIEAYEKILADEGTQTADFHLIENWRHRLIHEGTNALTEFIDTYQPPDLQFLRQLIKKATNEAKYPGSGKALFRYIRSCL